MYVHVCVCFYMLLLDITKGYELYVCACVCVFICYCWILLKVMSYMYVHVCVCLYVIVGYY
jgi:hypothetical protein